MRSTGTRYKSDGTGSQSVVGALGQPAEVIVYPAYFYFTNVGGSSGSTKGSIDSYSQVVLVVINSKLKDTFCYLRMAKST